VLIASQGFLLYTDPCVVEHAHRLGQGPDDSCGVWNATRLHSLGCVVSGDRFWFVSACGSNAFSHPRCPYRLSTGYSHAILSSVRNSAVRIVCSAYFVFPLTISMFFLFFFFIDAVAIIPYASCVSNLRELCLFLYTCLSRENCAMKNCDCIVNVHIAHRLPSREAQSLSVRKGAMWNRKRLYIR